VGRREDGQMVYFVADDELAGPMATRTVIDTVTARPAPLCDVETVWTEPEVPGVRTVLVPVAPGGQADGLSK